MSSQKKQTDKYHSRHSAGCKLAKRMQRAGHVLGASLLGAGMATLATASRAELPVRSQLWVTSGQAQIDNALSNSTNLVVDQLTDRATLNWDSFNISEDSAVTFRQPNTTSVALNRIHQNDPSRIFGSLTANGQVYLINQNGFVFGPNSRINTNTLITSALDITQEAVDNGISQAINANAPAFAGDGRLFVSDQQGNPIDFAVDANGDLLRRPDGALIPLAEAISEGLVPATATGQQVPVRIQVSPGAELSADNGGRLMLLAPEVINYGTLNAPDGQVILAAGQKVYLAQAPSGSGVRGFLVEVDVGGLVVNGDVVANNSVSDPDALVGQILAQRGNISLVGLSVNQNGLVSATTAVQQNGSIRLLARDSVATFTGVNQGSIPSATRTGDVSFGKNSVTRVTPEDNPQSVASDVTDQPQSIIEIMGDLVAFGESSQVVAPSGDIRITATDNPDETLNHGGTSRILVESGARIDASGEVIDRPFEDNILTVDLRADELKDSPLQKDGGLRGEEIVVDIRQRGVRGDGSVWEGTPVADVSGSIDSIQRTARQRSLTGGSISMRSEGDIIVDTGAVLDVSGGAINYAGGALNTTRLITLDNSIVSIDAADPDRLYADVLDPQANLSRLFNGYVPDYVEGKDAGTLTLSAPNQILAGQLLGDVQVGFYQRSTPTATLSSARYSDTRLYRPGDEVPLGGRLVIGEDRAGAGLVPDFGIDTAVFSRFDYAGSIPSMADPFPDALKGTVYLSPDIFTRYGSNRLEVSVNRDIQVPDDTTLTLSPGGELTLVATSTSIEGSVLIPGGDIDVSSIATSDTGGLNRVISLGSGSVLDTSGQWVNESPLLARGVPQGPLFTDGGSVSLTASNLVLPTGSVINVDAGARLDDLGRISGGNGGSIKLDGGWDVLGSRLSGFAVENGTGGSVSLDFSRALSIGRDGTLSGAFELSPDFFARSGFVDFSISAPNITLADDTTIAPRADFRQLDATAFTRGSGADLGAFSRVTTRPLYERDSVSLELDATTVATLGRNSRILLPHASQLSINGRNRVVLAGEVDAPGGRISVTQNLLNFSNADLPRELGIFLQPTARLSARGAFLDLPSDIGLRSARIFDGGEIRLDSASGYIVTADGSSIDVSGNAKVLDLGPVPVPTLAATEAGVIDVSAAEGILLYGDLAAQAALLPDGSGSSVPGGRGGLLRVTIGRDTRVDTSVQRLGNSTIPATARQIVLTDQALVGLPAGFTPGDEVPDVFNGRAVLSTDLIAGSGVDSLQARANDLVTEDINSTIFIAENGALVFEGNPDLALRNTLELDVSRVLGDGANARLSANYIALGSSSVNPVFAYINQASAGTGALDVSANFIDVVGNLQLSGIDSTSLESASDIRFRGVEVLDGAGRLSGQLTTTGDVTFKAAQVYASTLSEFDVALADTVGVDVNGLEFLSKAPVLRIESNGKSDSPVLSAASRLTFRANRIEQAGVVKAPLGEIVFDGQTLTLNQGDPQFEQLIDSSIILESGSLTSTSAEGLLVPFGQLQAGSELVADVGGITREFGPDADALPEKRISLLADNVNTQTGALLDVSGDSGDLFAYEFIGGVNGTQDLLSAAASSGSFAIIPGLNPDVAPVDPIYSDGSALAAGEAVFLESPALGLPAGVYTLLPARYALIPGAFLVTETGTRDIPNGQISQFDDGTVEVGGRRLVLGTNILDTRNQGYRITPGSSFVLQSDGQPSGLFARYAIDSVTQVLASQVDPGEGLGFRLPIDSGTITLAATRSLDLDASLRQTNLLGTVLGRGPLLDIASGRIALVGDAASGASGFLNITDSQLESFGAESLVLGGRRNSSAGGVDLNVVSSEILVESDVDLELAEIIFAATDDVTVKSGARISAVGERIDDQTLTATGDGALLLLSGLRNTTLIRQSSQGAGGVLNLEPGVALAADEAIVLDASLDTDYSAASIDVSNGLLTLGASRISLSETAPATAVSGLTLSGAQLSGLNAGGLVLNSRSSIDVNGAIQLTGKDLTLQAAGINGTGGSDVVVLSADGVLRLENPSQVQDGTGAGAGQLTLSGAAVELGDGDFSIEGFSSVDILSSSSLSMDGDGALSIAADTRLQASQIYGSAGVDYRVETTQGNLRLTAPATTAATGAAPTGFGSRLDFSTVGDLTIETQIINNSGIVTATAGGDVALTSAALIDVSGVDLQFGDVAYGTPGGDIALTSGGDLLLGTGSQLRASGANAGGDAGSLTLSAAQGTLILGAGLEASAQAGYRGGRFSLDVGGLAPGQVASLNSSLDQAGFFESRAIRARSGNIDVAQQIQSHSISLTADGGGINVSSLLDASGEQAGSITLAARDDVVLRSTAQLDARATGANEHGGRVYIGSDTGSLDLQPGSGIDVSGDVTGGKVTLRAQRVDSDGDGVADDIAILQIASNVNGARRVDAEAFQRYDFSASPSITNAALAGAQSDIAALMSNAPAIKARLGLDADPAFHLVPGVELRSDGDLVLAEDLDLFSWQSGGEAGYLTLRAQGDLRLDNELSDGFETITTTVPGPFGSTITQTSNVLGAQESWSYRLVAGADLGSAAPLTAQTSVAGGDILLAAGQRVRTGTGDIEASAARDIRLGDADSAIYTAGKDGGGIALQLLGTTRYATEGGNLSLHAGGDIVGAANQQLVNDWLWRTGGELVVFSLFPRVEEVQASGWAVSHDEFRQNVGALGGGNIDVAATGNVRDLSVVIPTIGRQLGGTDLSQSVVEVDGGGNFQVRAGSDVLGGRYYVGRGRGEITAGGSIGQGSDQFAPILAYAEGDYVLDARRDLRVDGFVHPTLLPRAALQLSSAGGIPVLDSGFYTQFAPNNFASLTSRSGDVVLKADTDALTNGALLPIEEQIGLRLTPPTLTSTAFQGSLFVDNQLTLLPGPKGNLELLAAANLEVNANIRMSDADRVNLGSFDNPVVAKNGVLGSAGGGGPTEIGNILNNSDVFGRGHSLVPVHSDEAQPPGTGPDNVQVRVVTRDGDILFGENVRIELAKSFHIEAGRDILGLSVDAQHVRDTDISLVKAGRDLLYPIIRDASSGAIRNNNASIQLGGPGRLDIITGGEFNLGTSAGVRTVGDTVNLALAADGADISLTVGVDGERDFATFIQTLFVDPASTQITGTAAPQDAQLAVNAGLYAFIGGFGEVLVRNVGGDIGVTGPQWAALSSSEREALFAALDPALLLARYQGLTPGQLAFLYDAGLQSTSGEFSPTSVGESADLLLALRKQDQQTVVYQTFYDELTASGREAAVSGSDDFSRGFAAIDNLFPQQSITGGDASLFFSQIRTIDGGDIGFLVPGGNVNAGLSTPPSDFGLTKGNEQLGIVAQRTGDIDVYLQGDFLVNESRVFAADGGGILMWSSEGDIDAGRGAKTALTAPPPIISFDPSGNLVIEFPPALSGSGIRAFVSSPGTVAGNVDLFAPRGVVNAADAGIGSAGNVTIGAREVLGADNIDIGGVGIGVPSAPAGGLAFGISGLSSATEAATKSAVESAKSVGADDEGIADREVALLAVEILGFGEECGDDQRNCKR